MQPNNGEEKKMLLFAWISIRRDDRAKMNTNCEDVIPLIVYFKADMEFVEIESRAGLPVFELNLFINRWIKSKIIWFWMGFKSETIWIYDSVHFE